MELELKDVSLTINGLVSYCKCKCKHCLLCSGDDEAQAVPYDKLEQLALKFQGWFEDNPQLDKSLMFSDLHTSVMWR